jgi:hypothetical protein
MMGEGGFVFHQDIRDRVTFGMEGLKILPRPQNYVKYFIGVSLFFGLDKAVLQTGRPF